MIHRNPSQSGKVIRMGLYGCNTYRTRDLVAGSEAGCPGKIKIVAGYDIDPAKVEDAARRYGAVPCLTEESFFDQDMDVVLICLPPNLHASTYERVAAQGFDVYLEKPVCVNDEGRKQLIDAMHRYNVRCYVGISYRYINPFLKVAQILLRPEAGKIIGVHHHWMQGPDTVRGSGNWRHRMELSGGQLNHHCCHLLDWMHWIGGPMDSVIASSYVHDTAVLQHEEQELTAAFTYANGGMAVFNLSQHAHANTQFGMVHTQNMGIHYAWGKDTYVKVFQTRRRVADEIYEWDADSCKDPGTHRDALQMKDFADAYLNDKPMPCSLEDGIRTYDFAKAVRESCRTGQRVALNTEVALV